MSSNETTESIQILLCLPFPPLGQILSTNGSLGQIKHTSKTPVIGGKSLCVCDLLQSNQTKVGGSGSGWQGVSQVDPVKPAPRSELPKVGLKFSKLVKVRDICDT